MRMSDWSSDVCSSDLASGWSSANPSYQQIDWIMGSPAATFSGTVVDQSTNDKAHSYTDHPFVHTTAQLTGSESGRSEEHTSELQSLMRISYAVFCLKK